MAADMMKTVDVTVIPRDVYTAKELRIELSRYRGKNVPPRTLRYWKQHLGIKRNRYGFFESSDLGILIQLVRWLNRGGKIQQFRLKLLEEIQNAR